MARWYLAAGLACLLIPVQSLALDLGEAFRLAKDYDAQMRVAEANAVQGAAEEGVARSRLFPQIAATGAQGKQDAKISYLSAGRVIKANPEIKRWSLQLRQSLYHPAEWNNWKRLSILADAGALGVEAETARLLLRVADAYLKLLESRTQLQVAKQEVGRYTESLQQAQRAFALGQGTRVEIEELRARLDGARALVVDWQGQIASGRQELAALIGREVTPEELAEIKGIQRLAQEILDEPVAHWTGKLLKENRELALLRAKVKAAEKYVQVQRAGHLPTVDLVATRSYSRSDTVSTIGQKNLSTTVEVQVAIPLYSGGGVSASVRSARGALEGELARLEGRKRDLITVTTSAYVRVRYGLEKLRALEQARRSARQALLATRKGLEAGIRNHVDVLVAEQDVAKARVQWVSAAYALLRSIMELWAATGDVEVLLSRLETAQ